jgi:hypothetical protein
MPYIWNNIKGLTLYTTPFLLYKKKNRLNKINYLYLVYQNDMMYKEVFCR